LITQGALGQTCKFVGWVADSATFDVWVGGDSNANLAARFVVAG
jgi:hypothetical protein